MGFVRHNRSRMLLYQNQGHSRWEIKTDGHLTIMLQGNKEGADPVYETLADEVMGHWERYHAQALRRLGELLRGDMEFYCHTVSFQDLCSGFDCSSVYTGGFEMMFWQGSPIDDRYVNYVIQFGKWGNVIGFRIFSR